MLNFFLSKHFILERVTCPRHKCGSTRFSKDKIKVTKKPLTTTTCATQNYSDTLVQLQEVSSTPRTTEQLSKKVQMTTMNNIEILPMPQTSTTITTNTQKPTTTTTSTTSTVSLKTILWDSVTVSPRTVPHYDINLQIESESSSISDAFPIDPAFIGRKNRFHLSRPGAKYPLGEKSTTYVNFNYEVKFIMLVQEYQTFHLPLLQLNSAY